MNIAAGLVAIMIAAIGGYVIVLKGVTTRDFGAVVLLGMVASTAARVLVQRRHASETARTFRRVDPFALVPAGSKSDLTFLPTAVRVPPILLAASVTGVLLSSTFSPVHTAAAAATTYEVPLAVS